MLLPQMHGPTGKCLAIFINFQALGTAPAAGDGAPTDGDGPPSRSVAELQVPTDQPPPTMVTGNAMVRLLPTNRSYLYSVLWRTKFTTLATDINL